MNEKKYTYESTTLGLPPLKMVLGDVPNPDPGSGRSAFRPFSADKPESESKTTVKRLIGYIQDTK